MWSQLYAYVCSFLLRRCSSRSNCHGLRITPGCNIWNKGHGKVAFRMQVHMIIWTSERAARPTLLSPLVFFLEFIFRINWTLCWPWWLEAPTSDWCCSGSERPSSPSILFFSGCHDGWWELENFCITRPEGAIHEFLHHLKLSLVKGSYLYSHRSCLWKIPAMRGNYYLILALCPRVAAKQLKFINLTN
jgi:hypothetical protein